MENEGKKLKKKETKPSNRKDKKTKKQKKNSKLTLNIKMDRRLSIERVENSLKYD